ncbi:MAG TPA: hypothetical protein VEG30_17185 [Terriglobales bacterium]|nr:hypothetical protein [Terriglobales bacterium]
MIGKFSLSRREVLERCIAFGAVTLAGSLTPSLAAAAWEQHERNLSPTPACELGPFYKRLAPNTGEMRHPGDPGMPLSISGVVYNMRGEVLPDATLELWQTDHLGHYDLEGYRYRAVLHSDSKGAYAAESVIPGHYPDRVCQHVHYLITAPGHKPLITQLYFATDPVFEGDPAKNYNRDPLISSRELVRPVMLVGDPKDVHASVHFELVLEKA